jgi:hypothetical protein
MTKQIDDVYSDLMGANAGVQLTIDGLDTGTPAPVAEPVTIQQDINAGVSTEVVKPGTEDDKVNVPDAGVINEATPSAPASEDAEWDAFIEGGTPEPVTATQFDYNSLGKALGLTEDVKSQDEIIKYVKTLKEQNENLSKSVIDDAIPKELKDAIEIAKSNGDYKSYLEIADIDYSQEDPKILFEEEVAELFYNKDGSFREEEYLEYINNVSDPDKMLRGRQIQRELIAVQERKKAEIKQRALIEKAENLRRLENSLEKFSKVGDYKVTPKAKQQIFTELSSGKFLDELGISGTGAHNWDKLMSQYFKAKYFDAIQAYNAQKAVTGDRRETLKDLSNPSVGRPASPQNPTQQVKKSAVDMYLENFNLK